MQQRVLCLVNEIASICLLDWTKEHLLYRVVLPWQVLQELDFLKDNKSGTFSQAKQKRAQRCVVHVIHIMHIIYLYIYI